MIYSKIKGTNFKCSKIVLGTHLFGTEIDERTSFALLERFLERGGNILDTASYYANWLPGEMHMSEKTIGKWLASSGSRREILIATKGGFPDIKRKKSRLFYKDVYEDIYKSLENLRTDYIDVYYLHKDDLNQQPEILIEMFNEAVKDFDIRSLGVSNWSFDRIKQANDYAAVKHLRPIIASQIKHSVAKVNTAPDDIFVMTEGEYDKYSKSELNLFAFSAQAKGFFTRLEESGKDGLTDMHKTQYLNEYNLKLAEKLKEIADKNQVTVSTIAVAMLINDTKLNTFAQIGPKTVEQLEALLDATNVKIFI